MLFLNKLHASMRINKGFNSHYLSNFKLNAVTNSAKYFSSSNFQSGVNINDSFNNNNELITWLPPISTVNYFDADSLYEGNLEFADNLTDILNSVNKEYYKYKFDFSLFLHTNDKNSKVDYYLAPDSGLPNMDSIDQQEMMMNMMLGKALWHNFKYHGYHNYLSELTDLEIIKQLDEYINCVEEHLLATANLINECGDAGFIEFRKSVLLKITRINKDKPSGGVYGDIKQYINKKNKYINRLTNRNNVRKYTTASYSSDHGLDKYNYRNNISKELLNTRMSISLLSILNQNVSDIEKQKQIEKYIFNESERDLVNKLKESSGLSNDKGLILLLKSIKDTTNAIDTFKSTKTLLKGKSYVYCFINTPTEIIISIIISMVIPHILKHDKIENQSVTQLYDKIGYMLIKEYYKIEYNKYQQWFNNNDDKEIVYKLKLKDESISIEKGLDFNDFIDRLPYSFNTTDYVKYACDMVELISIHSKLFSTNEIYNDDEKTSKRVLLISDETKNEILNLLSYNNNTLPMIVSPNDWDVDIKNDGDFKIIKHGGYLQNEEERISFIHKSRKNLGQIRLDGKQVVNTINYMQKVEYVINSEVLNIITDCLQDGLLNDHVFINYHPLTNQLSKLKQNNDYYTVNQIIQYNSLCYNNRSIIQNALIYNNDSSIYFPLFIDWRGRYYSKTSSFSYQGSDLSKSLFLFKNGEILNDDGIKRLKLYAANCYGVVKKSSNKSKLAWVEKNIESILSVDNKFWIKGKEPLQSLAVSLELRRYYDSTNKEGFISHLPVYIDATCNGLQHLASMVGDVNLARYVNLLKSSDDNIPKDLYAKMVERINLDIKDLVDNDLDNAILLKLNISREFIKRAIMTIPYGVTPRGIRNQLIDDHFILLPHKIDRLNAYKVKSDFIDPSLKDVVVFKLKDISNISQLLYNVLFNTYPSLVNVVDYLKNMNKLLKELGSDLGIIWKTPGGLIVEQKYVQFDVETVTTSIVGRKKSISLKKPKVTLDLRKQNHGIIPNLIHSLDASNISILVNKLIEDNKNINILTIHDCFATNARHTEDLMYRVKLAFLAIYGDNEYLINFHEYILEFMINKGFMLTKDKQYVVNSKGKKLKIPNHPELGKLKLKDDLILSPYFVY